MLDSRDRYARDLRRGDRVYTKGLTIVVNSEVIVGNTFVNFLDTEEASHEYHRDDILTVEREVPKSMNGKVPWFIRIDAFNLWPGASFVVDDGEWAPDTIQVVQRLERVADVEKVVIFHRDLNYLVMDENSAPGLPGKEDVMTLEYSVPVLVFGNVVNPNELDDNNMGVSSY